jgi:anaerobic selenocysteine-containing dehydrogenase
MGTEPTPEQMDDLVAAEVARDVALLGAVAPRRGVERLIDISLRKGPYGLTLDEVQAAPAGINLGALQPRLPEVLRTPSGRIELVPSQLAEECRRLAAVVLDPPELVLVGRRQLRTNNSWLRTLPRLTGGSSRCTAQVNPRDAQATGVLDGGRARMVSGTGSIEVEVEVTDDVMQGVVCLPHGWAPADGAWTEDATRGSNVNVLTPATGLDRLSGTAALNAVPVRLQPL